MTEANAFLFQVYFGNTVADYLWFVGFVLLGLIFERYLSRWLSNIIFRSIDKFAEGVTKEQLFGLLHRPLTILIQISIAFFASQHIEFPVEWDMAPKSEFGIRMLLHKGFQMVILISIAWIGLRIVDFFKIILMIRAAKTESKSDDQLIPFFVEILKILVVTFASFIGLSSVFGVDIASLVAGLGIGGLALALAAKESLENLLGSFTIFLDKPFTVGDLIKIGSSMGVVEQVGFRSTRLRTPEKSYLTIPNRNLINAELDNLSLRTFRRVDSNIGVLYSTKTEQIKAIVEEIQELLDNHPNTNQEGKCRFAGFGASSLDILVMYFIDTMDFDKFLEVRQEINFKIIDIVYKHGSDFAYPTQTIHLVKN